MIRKSNYNLRAMMEYLEHSIRTNKEIFAFNFEKLVFK